MGGDGMLSDEEEEEDDELEESSEEESGEESDDDGGDMEESSEEEGEETEDGEKKGVVPGVGDGVESVLPASAVDLRKQAGDETPAPPKQLYTVLQQTEADKEKQSTAVFQSDVAYAIPGATAAAAAAPPIPEGAESVLAKAVSDAGKRKRNANEEEE